MSWWMLESIITQKKKMNDWDHHNFRKEYASSLSVAVLKPWPKPTWGREGCLWLTGCTSSSSEAHGRSSSRKLEAGAAARPWRNTTYWLIPHALLRLLSYTTRDHLPGGRTTRSGLCYPCNLGPPTRRWRCPRWATPSHIRHLWRKWPQRCN